MLLLLRDPLVVAFNERSEHTSWKYVTEQGTLIPNWSKTCLIFWWHSSVLCFTKITWKSNFQSVFISKRPFGDYFQWNACTYLQKICARARCSLAKLIKNMWNYLVALVVFCFRKTASKYKKFSVFLLLRDPLVATLNETRASISRKYVAEQDIVMPN